MGVDADLFLWLPIAERTGGVSDRRTSFPGRDPDNADAKSTEAPISVNANQNVSRRRRVPRRETLPDKRSWLTRVGVVECTVLLNRASR